MSPLSPLFRSLRPDAWRADNCCGSSFAASLTRWYSTFIPWPCNHLYSSHRLKHRVPVDKCLLHGKSVSHLEALFIPGIAKYQRKHTNHKSMKNMRCPSQKATVKMPFIQHPIHISHPFPRHFFKRSLPIAKADEIYGNKLGVVTTASRFPTCSFIIIRTSELPFIYAHWVVWRCNITALVNSTSSSCRYCSGFLKIFLFGLTDLSYLSS